ncbi:tyrosine-type recombinase/integrase [Edaphobacter aggregans]|uniref:tyrosine-type recombinase/integrase n=1 Tax=Edaphobacter aggregans TaxID=570835 RepID=UPI0005554023|nr:site-specific integrase [Edaphobacter aggregans]
MAEKKKNRDGIFQRRGQFWMSFQDSRGKRHQCVLKGVISLTEAKNRRALKIAEIEKHKLLGHVPATKDVFATIIPNYLIHQKARLTPESYERTRGILEVHLKSFFGTMPLAGIRRADVQKYITQRLGEVSTDTVIKEINVLKHLLGLAMEWEMIPKNPAYRMGGKKDNMKASPGRVRYLQPAELNVVLEACPEWLRPIASLLAYTGMRRSEVLRLRWRDLDIKGGEIMLPKTKNGDARVVHLNDRASDVVKSLTRGFPAARVFSEDITAENVSVAFIRACRSVGIADFSLHDLRHTMASWMRMTGSDLQDVAKQLGHRDLRMTNRYAHLSGDHLSTAVKRLDSVFAPLKLGKEGA